MELAEPIELINRKLADYYGITDAGNPIWRVVWSDDQREKKLSKFTPEGLELIHPKVMEFKKYPYIKERWVLERLVVVPIQQQKELPVGIISYEPMWQFCVANTGEYAPPTIAAAKFIVDTVYAALGKASLGPKYRDPEAGSIEERKERVKLLEEQLFGDESSLALKTVTGEAVAYTGEPKIQSTEGVK